jgi:hypothetical protein
MSIGPGYLALDVCSGGGRAGGKKGPPSWLTFPSNTELGADKELIEFLVATKAI